MTNPATGMNFAATRIEPDQSESVDEGRLVLHKVAFLTLTPHKDGLWR